MAWPAVAAAAIGVAGLIATYVGSQKAAKAAREQGREESRIEGRLTEEKVRQIGKEERTMYGETLAQYTGGGVLSTMQNVGTTARPMAGSPATVLDEQQREFGYERDITKEVGASNVAQTLAGARALSDRYRYQGYANIASSISNILTGFG